MTAFVSTVGLLLEMLQALLHSQRAAFLGMAVLVVMIAADSPVADESLLDFTQPPLGFPGATASSKGLEPSALPDSPQMTQRPEFPNPLPINSESTHETWTSHFIWRQSTNEKSKPLMQRDAVTEEPHTSESSLSRTPEPVPGLSQQFEETADRITERNVELTHSEYQTSSPLLPPTRTKHQNSSIPSLSSSATGTSIPYLAIYSNDKRTSNIQEAVTAEKTLPSGILTRDRPPNSSVSTLAEEPFSQRVESSQASPINFSLVGSLPEHEQNMLSYDKIHSPGYNVPLSTSQPTLSSFEPNELPPEDFYPTNTMEVDWGSGDYLETMSYFNTDQDGYPLVTKVLSDPYDQEEYTESYDTSFPARVGISLTSLQHLHVSPSPSLFTTYSTIVPYRHPSLTASIPHLTLEITPTPMTDVPGESDIMWADSVTVQPTYVLLPDMNSLEYYTTQLTKDGFDVRAEENVTAVLMNSTEVSPIETYTHSSNATMEESSSELSGFGPLEESTTEDSRQLINSSAPILYPSIVPTHILYPLSSSWMVGDLSITDLSIQTFTDSTALSSILQPGETPLVPEDSMSASSLTDVHWFVTESLPEGTIHTSAVLTSTVAFSPVPTDIPVNDSTSDTTDGTHQNPTLSTEHTPSTYFTDFTSHNATLDPLVMSGDQGVTEDGNDHTATLISTASEVRTLSALPTSPAAMTTPYEGTKGASVTTESSSTVGFISPTREQTSAPATTPRQYLCKLDRPSYLTKIDFPSGATVGYAKSQLRDVLKLEFNKSVELQVVDPPPKLVIRVVSGSVIYTAISVVNGLQRSGRRLLYVAPSLTPPDRKYQVHTVLQFVPGHIDVRFCTFSESIERGLSRAFAEVRRRSQASTNFTVHIINITTAAPSNEERQSRFPVEITFTISGTRGYLKGSEVSDALMTLTVVEFSFYMGFPVLQIGEPFHYPELNTSQLLRSTWVRTVLLGVLDDEVTQRTFQANLERRVALLFKEALGSVRRVRRAATVDNSSIQVVAASRLAGEDHPLEVVYFAESPGGERMPAVQTANLLNSLDIQRAAIVLGYRVRGVLAQPVEKVASSPSDKENANVWIGVGVVVPLLVVLLILSILYWKLCRTDKLEFQPDAMTAIQQKQKLQAPSVKGFDFAKLHLGQQSKDDVMVIQEPVPPAPASGPLPTAVKDGPSPSDNGEIATAKSKTSASSTKASHGGRRRERISPSDRDSVVSDHSTEWESTGENLRATAAAPSDSKQTRKPPINVLNGPPPSNGAANEQPSSAAIFEPVDRTSRAADAARRLPNKIQLIAMQPMAVPALHSPPSHGRLADAEQIQVALRHKSEIEHHRNKIRLRAKRKGHYDFPAMEDLITGVGDAEDRHHIYHKAQSQMDKILDPESQMLPVFREQRKSRGRRSPRQRLRSQLNGGMMEADKDHLITEDDPAYRKGPGLNNVAYVSDPDQGPVSPHRSPSPTDEVFLGPASSPPGHAPPPPPYIPPQPSIEEARQQMHSLLDDAFALVSPTSHGSTAGITLPGGNGNPLVKSPAGCGPRAWGPTYSAFGPAPSRFPEPPPLSSAAGLTPRQGFGSAYTPAGEEVAPAEQLQSDGPYSRRGYYADEPPSSARPRPVGGTTGTQLHHLAQVGLTGHANGYPAGVRAAFPGGQNGGVGWNRYHDNSFTREEPEKDAMHRSAAPPAHLDAAGVGYLTPQRDISPPTHSSASLIKAIREELLRLSQKQTAASGYRS
uniref:Si:ch211-1e14.1 n=1 Tax=Oryzias latipes TaxID=8090 RepID=A0A3P9KLS9_ORYLA